jgi:hypothetical protein
LPVILLGCLLAAVLSCPAWAASPKPPKASDLAPIVAQDAAVLPGDPDWPLARQTVGPLVYAVSIDSQAVPPGAASGPAGPGAFRIEYDLKDKAEDCACIGTTVRLSHYRSRGIEFAVRASPPVAAVIYITTSSTDDRNSRDRFFGTFHAGEEWKVMRLRFSSFAADPAWPAEALRTGFTPGDLVLRPDSVESIRIGMDARRTAPGKGVLWVGGVRFFR